MSGSSAPARKVPESQERELFVTPGRLIAAGTALLLLGLGSFLQSESALALTSRGLGLLPVFIGVGIIMASSFWWKAERYRSSETRLLRDRMSELADEKRSLEARLREIPALSSRGRTAEGIVVLMAKASNGIRILGINAIMPIHQGRRLLIDLLKRGGRVQVLLLNRDSSAFKERELLEEHAESGVISGRLRAEQDATLASLRDIRNRLTDKQRLSLEVRLHSHKPEFALIISDEDLLQVNIYVMRPGYPGSHGPTLELSSSEPKFPEYINLFQKLWEEAKIVNLAT